MSRDKKDNGGVAVATIEPDIDVQRIEVLGNDVVSAMQSIRELLEARAGALEACRSALQEHHDKLRQEEETFAQRETELCEQFERRETELQQRENQLAEREQEIHAEAEAVRREWDARIREVDDARTSLAALQKQLEQELEQVTAQQGELLPRLGTNGDAAGGLPSAADLNARESVERFQKLCRDAKRRAIGA